MSVASVQGQFRVSNAAHSCLPCSGLNVLAEILMTRTFCAGDSQDFRRIHRCAELIHRKAQQLLSCSYLDGMSLSSSLLDSPLSPHSSPGAATLDVKPHSKSIPSWRSSNADSVSILSDSQMEHLDFATQEVLSSSQSLMDRVQKFEGPDRASATPSRGKRMLPASPDKAFASPGVHLQRESIRRNIALASSALDSWCAGMLCIMWKEDASCLTW